MTHYGKKEKPLLLLLFNLCREKSSFYHFIVCTKQFSTILWALLWCPSALGVSLVFTIDVPSYSPWTWIFSLTLYSENSFFPMKSYKSPPIDGVYTDSPVYLSFDSVNDKWRITTSSNRTPEINLPIYNYFIVKNISLEKEWWCNSLATGDKTASHTWNVILINYSRISL